MKLFTISTACALLTVITHAIPGPLVPAPAVAAPVIEARQVDPIAVAILASPDGGKTFILIESTNIVVAVCTYLPYYIYT